MKKLLLGVLGIIVLTSIFVGCGPSNNELACIKAIQGRHSLRKFNVKTSTATTTSAEFFLIVGSYSSETTENTTVRFYFLNNKAEYQFMEKDLADVNIKTDANNSAPYVTFNYSINFIDPDNPYYMNVDKVIIHCNEGDFQPEININSLK